VVTEYTYDAFGSASATNAVIANSFQFTGRENDGPTGLYYYRARYYHPSLQRFISEDPNDLDDVVNLYAYARSNPLTYVDPDGRDAIYIEYPDYSVNTGFGFNAPLGHAAVIAIDPKTGTTKYFEYGRYDSDFGQVKGPPDRRVPDVTIGPNGKPTRESLARLYDFASRNYGKGSRVEATYYDDADYQRVIDFAMQRMRDPNRRAYSWNLLKPNHCYSFANEAIQAGRRRP
jgi:RHS repeat-associated protein